MSRRAAKSFRAVLEATGRRPRFVIARVPVDLKKAWPDWTNRRVRGTINGIAFQSTLFPYDKGAGHLLLVNKNLQKAADASVGDTVLIRIEPDFNEQSFSVPAELSRALKSDKAVLRWFERLSPSVQKGIGQFVDQAKGERTRKERAEKMVESLMLAMDGEQELPPILRASFQLEPLADAGWQAMTPTQRRNHLLGIFYVQTVAGRERRAAKAVEDAVRIARKATERRVNA